MPDVCAQRNGSRGQQALVIARLDVVDAMHQIVEVGASARCRIEMLGVEIQAFQTTPFDQQGAVERFVPMPGQPHFRESGIERWTVPVALGVGQGSVDIKNQCSQSHRELPEIIEYGEG
ncbi:hypothetical protein SDC9_156714 [bioreactor metagenome]|uniref:Uncharacterized protein n=1 Tax=bioreactor metagenome TaxID=1076179 RepID=A0A645FA37_9ZZZZ